MAPAPGEVGVGRVAVLPDYRNLDDCPVFESNYGPSAAIPDERFEDIIIRDPTRLTGLDGFLIRCGCSR